MSVRTDRRDDAATYDDSRLAACLDRLWGELPRLRGVQFGRELARRLEDHVSALRYLHHARGDRPILIGFVGGASCGKSTLFNSLVGRQVSRIHYQPHSSLGPILWAHQDHRAELFESAPRRFLPQFEIEQLRATSQPVTGDLHTVSVALHADDRWKQVGLLDLPDMSSESARREGWLVRHLLPWLDQIVWVVDPNDYLFEDLYIDFIEETAALGQRSVVVVNDIHGQVQSDSAVLRERVLRFRPEAWFVLPRLRCSVEQPYPLFDHEPEFVRFSEALLGRRVSRPVEPLVARVRHDVVALLHANAEWLRLASELSAATTRITARQRRRILSSAPLLSVLPEAAQEELDRLRNRFSLWHHGTRLYRTLRSPARAVGQAAMRRLQLSIDDLDTEPLYRHLVGSLKEFGVELHRAYLESRLVERAQQTDPQADVLGSFEPESLDFRGELDAVARHLFIGAQQMLSDPSLLKDKRFQFVLGTSGVALVFLAAQSLLGLVGVTFLVSKGLTALAAVLSPELARLLPLDRMSRLAAEAREMLAAVLDRQMQAMVAFYTAPRDGYLDGTDRLIPLLESVRDECGTVEESR